MANGTVDELIALSASNKKPVQRGKTEPQAGSVDDLIALSKSQPKTAKPKGKAPNIAQAIGHGATAALGGLVQLAAQGTDKITGRDDSNSINRILKMADARYQQDRAAGGKEGIDGWSAVGEIGATLLPVSKVAPLFNGAKIFSKTGAKVLAGNAAVGAGVGVAHTADDNTDRLKNAAGAAVGGAVGAGVGQKIGQAVTKGANIAKNRLNPDAQTINELSKKFGVRTSVGDITRGANTQRAEVLMEQVPVLGTGGFRAAQQTEAASAAKKAVDGAKKAMSDLDFKSLGKIQAAANAGDRNAARVLDVVNKAGNDPSKVIQAGAEVRLWREGKIAGQLYDDAARIAKAQGGVVTPTNYSNLLNQEIGKLNQSLAPNDPLFAELTRIQARLNDPNRVTDFANMRLLRSELGNIADGFGSGVSPNKHAAKVIGDLREAVEKDIQSYAMNSGNANLKHTYQKADLFYKSALKNRDSGIAKALKSDKPDEIYAQFIKTGKADRADNFYRSLDPKAQAALRYEMANIALDKATNPNTQVFSPAKFAAEFERMRDPYGSIFKGADKAEMDGLVKLMRHVERAGQYAENPPTGNRMVGAAMVGSTIVNPPVAAKVGISTVALKALLTTPTGKRILLSANDLPPNSPKLANLVKMSQSLSTTTGANTGVNTGKK